MNRQRRKDQQTAEIDADLRDRTSEVLIKENEVHRWDVRCYTAYGPHQSSRRAYIGGTSSIATFDKAMELANFYAPCKEAIRVEVGVSM